MALLGGALFILLKPLLDNRHQGADGSLQGRNAPLVGRDPGIVDGLAHRLTAMVQLLGNLSHRLAVQKILPAYDLLLVHRDHLLYPSGPRCRSNILYPKGRQRWSPFLWPKLAQMVPFSMTIHNLSPSFFLTLENASKIFPCSNLLARFIFAAGSLFFPQWRILEVSIPTR